MTSAPPAPPTPTKEPRRLRWALVAALAAATALLATRPPPRGEGCAAYTPSTMPLIAHGGGGLPDAIYANNRAALDRAVANGFSLIEVDLTEKDGALLLWHEGYPPGDMSLADLAAWMRAHPEVRIVLDFKSDMLAGLAAVKAAAPGLEDRFIPELHRIEDYEAVRALGFADMMLAIYWLRPENTAWAARANELPLFGVAIPVDRKAQAELTRHPVYLHTVNETMPGFGAYTDCLIPA